MSRCREQIAFAGGTFRMYSITSLGYTSPENVYIIIIFYYFSVHRMQITSSRDAECRERKVGNCRRCGSRQD